MLRRAVEHFNADGCGLVIHVGDVVAPFAMAVMGELKCPFRAVYGNNDGEKIGLKIKAASVGGSIEEPPVQLTAGGLAIRVVHDCADWEAEAQSSGADVVVFGHTHDTLVESQCGKELPLGINPGECGGWLTGNCTAAILDTATLLVRIVDLNLEPGKGID
jgi:uncharacterized protein